MLGLLEEYYGFSVFDSGVPFEPDTLSRLGTGFVTTRAHTGGSGIGFATTFDTMKEFRASLVISEYVPDGASFTKSVTIRFDGKHEYVIETFRPEAFPEDNRYLIVEES